MEQRVIGRRAVVGNQWQLDHTGTREAAKRIRLVSPVHVTWPGGVTLGHVLGVPVVGAHPCHGVSNARDVTGRAHSARVHGIRAVRSPPAHTGNTAVGSMMVPGPIWRKVKFALWAVRLYGAVRHKERGRSGSASILGRENGWHPNV